VTNRAGVPFPSSEDGNRSSFQNVVFSSYVEFWTMDKVTVSFKRMFNGSEVLKEVAYIEHYCIFLAITLCSLVEINLLVPK
jgi:hypothetical protein